MKRSTMLPATLVVVIVLLALFAISSGRSNAPDVVVDSAYPHYACVIQRYCAGEACSSEPISFVAYLRHEDGQPRLEMPGFSPQATVTEIPDGLAFESLSGTIRGTITVFTDGGLDLTAVSGAGDTVTEHYGSGSCDRLSTP